MELKELIRLLLRNWIWLVIVPVLLASSILFFMILGKKKIYVSDTTIYTGIASGYSITGNVETDYYSTSTAFDNLIALINSRETKEEVAIRLLTTHLMLKEPESNILNANSFNKVNEILSPKLKAALLAPSYTATYNNVLSHFKSDYTNEIYRLLNSEEDFYSLNALSNLNVSRIRDSDVIKVEYESSDPAICKHTLELLTEVFINKNRVLREGQTNSVVNYYLAEAENAYDKLEEIERRFLTFNEDNQIINFEEQSKNISTHRESLYTDYASVEMLYVAAKSALSTIENKLDLKSGSTLSSNELLDLKSRVTNLSSQLVDIDLLGRSISNNASTEKALNLRNELEESTGKIRHHLGDYYTQTHSISGIPNQGLLDEWVRNMILVEEGAAKLQVMDKRKNEFLREYQRMAPLGAALKQIEREIELAEKEYLSVLNSLNSSRLNQQNIALTAQLDIVDPPYLPVKAKSSKTIFMVLLGAIGGFISVASIIVTRAFMDNTIKSAAGASSIIGFPVAGVMPILKQNGNSKSTDLEDKATVQLARHLIVTMKKYPNEGPFIVGFMSNFKGEGKSTVIDKLKSQLAALGINAISYHPKSSVQKDSNTHYHTFWYTPQDAIKLREEIINKANNLADAEMLLIEYPSLSEDIFPIDLVPMLHLILITVRANRVWSKADERAFYAVLELSEASKEVLVTGVQTHDCEEFIGPLNS